MAKKYKSFLEYLKDNYAKRIASFMHDWYEATNRYCFQEEIDDPEKYQYSLNFNEFDIISVHPLRSPNYTLHFDLRIRIAGEVIDLMDGELTSCPFDERFTLRFNAVLMNGLRNLRVVSVKEGNNPKDYDKKEVLNQFFVPYVTKEESEELAESILRELLPEALRDPMFVAPPKIMNKLSLDVKFGPLPKDCFGKTIFAAEEIEILNFDKEELVRYVAKPGTIVISYNILDDKKFGGLNFVAIHECVHWYLHRKYFELMMLLNNGETSLLCKPESMDNVSNAEFKNKYAMENQANSLASKILMPKEMAKKKFEQIVREVRRSTGLKKEALYEASVRQFAKFFGTSIKASKIRLRELGYTQIESIIDYGNDVRFHRCRSYELKPGETYSLHEDDFKKLLAENDYFRKLISSGLFVYADHMVVMNERKYVRKYKKKTGYKMLQAALRDVSKCCLLFKIERSTISVSYNPEVFNLMTFSNGGFTSESATVPTLNYEHAQNQAVIGRIRANGGTSSYKDTTAIMTELKKFPDFASKLNWLLTNEPYKMSDREVEKRSNISHTSICNYRNGKHPITKKNLHAICGAMRLDPMISTHLFNTAGFSLSLLPDETINSMYDYLTIVKPADGLESWNNEIMEKYPNNPEFRLP